MRDVIENAGGKTQFYAAVLCATLVIIGAVGSYFTMFHH